MLGAIKERLSEFSTLKEGLLSCITYTGETQKNMTKKNRLTQIEEEIDELLSKVSGAISVLMKYIDEKGIRIRHRTESLAGRNRYLKCHRHRGQIKAITSHVNTWETLSFEDKQAVVDTLIKVIRIADGNIEITWNI